MRTHISGVNILINRRDMVFMHSERTGSGILNKGALESVSGARNEGNNERKNERVTIVLKQTIFLQNNRRPTDLTENKHTRSAQQIVEDEHFARVLGEVLIGGVRRIGFDAAEKLGEPYGAVTMRV